MLGGQTENVEPAEHDPSAASEEKPVLLEAVPSRGDELQGCEPAPAKKSSDAHMVEGAHDQGSDEQQQQQQQQQQQTQQQTEPSDVDSAPSLVLTQGCFGCESRFPGLEEFLSHLRQSQQCIGVAWQAAVDSILALPGAGTQLWCPACPDSFIGKWTGPASRAAALLRHLDAASTVGSLHQQPHARLQQLLVELLLAGIPMDVPPFEDSPQAEHLLVWAENSRMREAAGPLLAKPGPEARRAIQKLQERTLGRDPFGDETEASGIESVHPTKKTPTASEPDPIDDNREVVDFAKLKMPKVDNPSADLYGDLAPTDSKGNAVICLSDSEGEGPVVFL